MVSYGYQHPRSREVAFYFDISKTHPSWKGKPLCCRRFQLQLPKPYPQEQKTSFITQGKTHTNLNSLPSLFSRTGFLPM